MKYVLILLTVLSLFGCQPAKEHVADSVSDMEKLVVIDSEACFGDTTIYLSSLIDTLQIVTLGPGSAPVGGVYDLTMTDQHVLIIPGSDQDSVKMMDLDGTTLFSIPMPSFDGDIPSYVNGAIDEPRRKVYLSKQGEIESYDFDGTLHRTYTIKEIHNPSLYLYPSGNLAVVSMCFSDLGDTVAVAQFNPDMEVNGVEDVTVCHYPPLQAGVSSLGSLYDNTRAIGMSSKLLFSFILTTDTTYYYDAENNKIFPHIVVDNHSFSRDILKYSYELLTGYIGGCESINGREYYWLDKQSGKVMELTIFDDYLGRNVHPYYLSDDDYCMFFNMRTHRNYVQNLLKNESLTDSQRQRIESILNAPENCLVIMRGEKIN